MPSGAGAWASCRSSRPNSRGTVSVAGHRGAACRLGDLPGLGESGRAQGGFKGSPPPCPESGLWGGWGRRCAGPRALVGEGLAILTVAPFLPSHLRTQGLPGKWPPKNPSPPCGRRGLGAPGLSRLKAPPRAGLGARAPLVRRLPQGQGWGPGPLSSGGSPKGRAGGLGSRCLWGESRVPVLLLVSSERSSPQGPEEAGQTLPSSPSHPGAGWGPPAPRGSCCGFK